MEHRAIEFVVEESALGALLVAATSRGVCLVRFGGGEAALTALVGEHFPWAMLEAGGPRLRGYARDIAGCAAGRPLIREIPLDVRGSRFQELVWAALREIPHGETRSYAVVAGAIGRPRAVRAVANACANNPVPLVVPCHRVVRTDGGIGGYLAGSERKQALLEAEAGPGYFEGATAPASTSASRSASTRARLTPASP
jgi:AraC family transcriptional regulator of adaptative response/methylated-DNA-[protein]-cysteine methyltransferase